AVFRLLEQVEQLIDRLARDPRGCEKRTAFIGNAVDAAVCAIAVGVAYVVLHVADDRVLPVEEVDGAVRRNLDVRGTETWITGKDDLVGLSAGEARILVADFVLQNTLETDDICHEQVALHVLREVPAGEDFHAGTRPGPLLIDLGRMWMFLRIFQMA